MSTTAPSTTALSTTALSTTTAGTQTVFDYDVPVDPMDDLQCESCQ